MALLSRLLPLLSLFLAAPLALAQRGDRRDEKQPPPPAHIKIPPAPILSPEEELKTFTLAPGFRAELVAADPLIGDPVAMQFGPDGRLWVVEMRGYMQDADGRDEDAPIGNVVVLADTDGDGRYDQRTVFADKLVMPRAISLVGDGVLVAEPPHLWFFRDTDGDGRADDKTEIAGDYASPRNPEHSANGLMWAMDNWIYSAKHNVRFRWEGGAKFAREATIPRGQWGISQDDAGRLFYNTNSDPLRYDAVPSSYLKRNPHFTAAAGTNVQLVPGNLRLWPGRVTPGVNRGYQSLNAEGKITSMTGASGPAIYRGALFPEEFRGNGFVPEVTGNLVKRIVLTTTEGALKGANAYEGAEFMTSTDERFRPVNVFNGPDGALYVVDMYRGIIQHRIFLTTFLRRQIEERGLDKGIGLGRIWRIVPDGAPPADFRFNLARASTSELVVKLGDENGWVRDTAQRLLVARRDSATTAALAQMAVSLGKPALARLHALWTLEGSGALDRATVIAALRDADARVAAAAIRLSEKFFKSGTGAPPVKHENHGQDARATSDPELLARVASLVQTRSEPEIRLQLALTLGEARTPGSDEALRALVVAAGRQPFLAEAVVSGLAGREVAFIEGLVKHPRAAANAGDALRFATSAVLKSGHTPRIERVLALSAAPTTPEWGRAALLAGVRHFLPRSPDGKALTGTLPIEPKPLLALAANQSAAASQVAQQLLDQLRWPGKPGAAAAARPLTAAEQMMFEQGRTKFAQVCAACHQPNGQGLAGLAPSLVFSRWVLGDPRITARIVLHGKAQENVIMPPWKAALNDEEIAGVLTFIRRSWDNDADPVSPAVVAEVRKETATREEPFTVPELDELAQTLRPRRARSR